MNILGWLELAIFLIVLLLITKPLGLYLVQVLDTHGKTFMDPVVKPVEKITYRLLGVDPEKEQSWLQYTIALLVFTVVTVLFT
jgi:potassium-transporting ATPase potassium-binding subunit